MKQLGLVLWRNRGRNASHLRLWVLTVSSSLPLSKSAFLRHLDQTEGKGNHRFLNTSNEPATALGTLLPNLFLSSLFIAPILEVGH